MPFFVDSSQRIFVSSSIAKDAGLVVSSHYYDTIIAIVSKKCREGLFTERCPAD
jgi:hypothetical protein